MFFKNTIQSKFAQTAAYLFMMLATSGCLSTGSADYSSSTSEGSGAIDVSSSTHFDSVNYGPCHTDVLSEAWDFNVFTFENLTQPGSVIEGRVAAGGNVLISNLSIGSAKVSDANRVDLIAGGDLNFVSGAVLNGSVLYSGNGTLTSFGTAFGGFIQASSPILFSNVATYLKSMSSELGSLTSNGQTGFNDYGGNAKHETHLNGADAVINVFSMTGEDIERTHTLNITVPEGSTVLINVNGSSATIDGFNIALHGVDEHHIIYNFKEASSIYITAIELLGSVLAPNADVTFASGQVSGQLISKSLYSQGQFNDRQFRGCLPF